MTNQQGFWGLREAEVRTLDTVYELAEKAGRGGDVPVGAVLLTADGVVAGLGLNQREVAPFDPTAHAEILALREAAGRIAAETIAFYPPGIPVICTGEVFTAEVCRYIEAMAAAGLKVTGAADASLRTLRVIADDVGQEE